MGVKRRFYCPWCGTSINEDTLKFLRFGPGKKCFDPWCEGEPDAPVA